MKAKTRLFTPNDRDRIYLLLKYNIYADDIVLHTFATNSTQNNYFQDCINSTTNWLTNNNLLINSNKTKLINISRTRTAYFLNIYTRYI